MDAQVSVATATAKELVLNLAGHVSSSNAGEVEDALTVLRDQNPAGTITIDAQDLSYVSSAGLRVLIRLLRKESDLTVINASPDVYDVFHMTGFTEMMTVRKALRTMSVDGLEVIGVGATAKVYRLDAETILKVFNSNVSMDMIDREITRSRAAFVSGVNTAIPFDVVRVGECFGTVYELLDAQDFIAVMAQDKEHLYDNVRKFAREIKKMHTVEVDTSKFSSAKQTSLERLPSLEGVVCTSEEVAKLRRIYELIPDCTTFVHGDCHPGNVMVQNGEFVFVDLASSGYGHPIFDMMAMCMIFQFAARQEKTRKTSPYTCHFTMQECLSIFDTFVRAYLDTDDEELLSKAKRQIAGFAATRLLFVAIAVPGLVSPEGLKVAKQVAMAYADGELEPLCF